MIKLKTFVNRIKPPRHVKNVIMMINNADDVFQLCICTKTKAQQPVKIKAKADVNKYARYIS